MGPEIGPCVPVIQAERMRCFSDEAADELSSRAGSSHSDRQAADESSLAGPAPGRMRIVARLARQATGGLRDRLHSMSLGCTVPIHGRMTRLCGPVHKQHQLKKPCDASTSQAPRGNWTVNGPGRACAAGTSLAQQRRNGMGTLHPTWHVPCVHCSQEVASQLAARTQRTHNGAALYAQ